MLITNTINSLQGADATGTGTLQTLKGYCPSLSAIEEMETTTAYQAAQLGQSQTIADMMTAGFTADDIATAIDALTYIIDHPEDYE